MMETLEKVEQEYRDVMVMAREIGMELRKLSSSELFLDGASNILSLPEISRADEAHNLFRMMEEKQLLAHLLENEFSLEMPGLLADEAAQDSKPKNKKKKKGENTGGKVHVRIGSENPVKALQNVSVVSSTYQMADRTVGVLGIMGPKRMEYPKMIAIVDYFSKMMNQLLKELEKK